jgi:hypothetical protein
MRRCGITHSDRMIAGLLVGLLAILTLPLCAQPAATSAHQFVAYDKTHEITVNGTVQEVVTKPGKGSPTGLHVIVTSSQGTFDTHLGPYVTKQNREALKTGLPIQIVGAIEKVRSKQYLLARQVIFSGRTITVRGTNGFLAVENPHSKHGGLVAKTTQPEANGGAR